MRSIRLPLALAAVAALLLAGCGSSTVPHATISPAATLYVLDFGKPPTAAQVRPYEQALREAAHRCQDTELTVAHYTAGTVKQIADDTGAHRTALEVLRRFPKTMKPDLSCTQRFTAYALVLESSA